MVRIKAYHRKQTIPEYGGLYYFECVDCEKVAEVFCLEADRERNKYLKSGLCPRCFEVAVEVKLRQVAEEQLDLGGEKPSSPFGMDAMICKCGKKALPTGEVAFMGKVGRSGKVYACDNPSCHFGGFTRFGLVEDHDWCCQVEGR